MKHVWDEYDEYRAQQAEAQMARWVANVRSLWAGVKTFFAAAVRP